MRPRILVVEDEPRLRDLVAQVLLEEGYEVERAENGAVALDAINGGTAFDLVVLDMWMPIVNGWQFAAALAQRKVSVPLLVITAANEARARAREVGAVGYIGKPFDLDELVDSVRNAMPPPGAKDVSPSISPVATEPHPRPGPLTFRFGAP